VVTPNSSVTFSRTPTNQFAVQQGARCQQRAHELVGAELPPVDTGRTACRLGQVPFVRRHHGKGGLACLAEHRRAVEHCMAEFVVERRALEVIPLGDHRRVQADQDDARKGRIDLRDTERFTPLSIMDGAVEIPVGGNGNAVHHHVPGSPDDTVEVEAWNATAREQALAHLIGNAPDLARLHWARLARSMVVGIGNRQRHRPLIQRKLYRWSRSEPEGVFRELWNWVTDPRNLRLAWRRVASNRGARTAGLDKVTVRLIQRRAHGVERFLAETRSSTIRRSGTPAQSFSTSCPISGQSRSRLAAVSSTTVLTEGSAFRSASNLSDARWIGRFS
jgi:hypothetical protein